MTSAARTLLRTMLAARACRLIYEHGTITIDLDAIPTAAGVDLSDHYGFEVEANGQGWILPADSLRDPTTGAYITPAEGATLTETVTLDASGKLTETRTYQIARPAPGASAVEPYSRPGVAHRIFSVRIS